MDGLEEKYEKLAKEVVFDENYLKLLVYHAKTPTSKNFIVGRDKLEKIFEAYMIETYLGGFAHGKDEVEKAKQFFQVKFNELITTPVEGVIPEETLAWYQSYSVYLAGIYSEAILEKAEGIILESIESGLHPKDIVKVLQNSPEFKNFSEHRLETITRTEGTKAYNKGRLDQFKDTGEFVRAVQYSAVLDRRTTTLCKRLHGKIMDINNGLINVYLPPNHFNCRSIIIPVTRYDSWKESDFKDVPKPNNGFDNPEWRPKGN